MAASKPAPERRGDRRIPAQIAIRYGRQGEFRRAETCDISPAGVGLIAPILYPVGTELDLRFELPEQPHRGLVLLRGMVCHSAGNRMGVRFANLVGPEHAKVLALIRQLAERN
jgi:PilZ domain-containing protein